MTNVMNYRGYSARVEFDPRDNIFWGKVLGIVDTITFEGDTVAELTKDFHNAVDGYLEHCAKAGREPHKPASGKLMLRVPPEIHTAVQVAAKAAGMSLNRWATSVLEKAAKNHR